MIEQPKECISFKLNVTSHPESCSGSSNVLAFYGENGTVRILRAAQHAALTVCSIYKLLQYYSNRSMCEKKNGRSS